MALGKGERGVSRETAEHRDFARRRAQQIEMAAAADAIADEAGETQPRDRSARNRAPTAATVRAIPEASVTRSTGAASHFAISARRAFVGGRRGAVEQSHHAFDHRDVGVARGAREGREHGVATHHPAVEIVRGRRAARA